MGREVKRVPIDFSWPINKVWFGYVIDATPCELCSCNEQNDDCPICDYGYIHHNVEPPTGDGWQMWETVSEGSPISPPMPSPEDLARWLADNGASACGRETATYEQWLGMIRSGWAPSMVMSTAHGVGSGVAGVARAEDSTEEHTDGA